MDRIVNVKYLRVCKLWEGSNEQLDFQYAGGLKLSTLKHKAEMLKNVGGDITNDEIEYLNAINETIRIYEPNWR